MEASGSAIRRGRLQATTQESHSPLPLLTCEERFPTGDVGPQDRPIGQHCNLHAWTRRLSGSWGRTHRDSRSACVYQVCIRSMSHISLLKHTCMSPLSTATSSSYPLTSSRCTYAMFAIQAAGWSGGRLARKVSQACQPGREWGTEDNPCEHDCGVQTLPTHPPPFTLLTLGCSATSLGTKCLMVWGVRY